jgi:hypothetical protein
VSAGFSKAPPTRNQRNREKTAEYFKKNKEKLGD